MEKKPFVIVVTIFLLIMLLALSFLEIPSIVQNIIYLLFGVVGAYFIYKYYFESMSDDEKKKFKIKTDFDKKKKEE